MDGFGQPRSARAPDRGVAEGGGVPTTFLNSSKNREQFFGIPRKTGNCQQKRNPHMPFCNRGQFCDMSQWLSPPVTLATRRAGSGHVFKGS